MERLYGARYLLVDSSASPSKNRSTPPGCNEGMRLHYGRVDWIHVGKNSRHSLWCTNASAACNRELYRRISCLRTLFIPGSCYKAENGEIEFVLSCYCHAQRFMLKDNERTF